MERVLPPNTPQQQRPSTITHDDDHPMQRVMSSDQPTTHSISTLKAPQKMHRGLRWLLWTMFLSSIITAAIITFAGYSYYQTVYHTLPDVGELKNVQMQVPLRVYTSDMKLIAEYGEKKRIPLTYEQFPPQMIQAILAAEDDRFFEHPGVDYQGILRAAYELVKTGQKSQGGSTITMQVARNFFLSPEKSFMRKINEIVLSFKIEHELTKQEILTLYLNKIFLGHRSYGMAAAAQTYFGKPIDQLSVDQFAILAGLPKAPSSLNPVTNAEAAKKRRDYVLRRMTDLGYLTEEEKLAAQAKPVEASIHNATPEANGDYVAEMARQWALDTFGETALEQGLAIVTTVRSDLQTQAQQAINKGVISYERRHGYRGPAKTLDAAAMQAWPTNVNDVNDVIVPDSLVIGLVTAFNDKARTASVKLKDGSSITLDAKTLEWAKGFKEPNRKTFLQMGDVIYLEAQNNMWLLAQMPRIQAALASVDSKTGAVLALSGGYDFSRNQYNRAVQARRQPGSSFKPFLYAAAIEKGYTPATIINDAPITQYDEFSEDYWRPENYTGKFGGPTRMRMALVASLNLVSIRIMQDIGVNYFLEFAQSIGIDTTEMQSIQNLSIALGTASINVLEHTGNYAMFANGGYRIRPHFVSKVLDAKQMPIFEATIKPFCDENCTETNAKRVLKPNTHYLVTSMMQDVVRMGTGNGAMVLKRNDLAGKTGTTNDIKDTWFMGFNPDIVTGVWMGFDQPVSMGRQESGGSSALPIWVDFMRLALKDKPDVGYAKPVDIVTRRIDPTTGELMADDRGGVPEVFDKDNIPAIAAPDPLRELQHELF